MAECYELTFIWPHTEPNDVVVTGTFDNWSSSVHLQRNDAGFEGKVKVPWGSKVVYKFRLDGDWIVLEDQPTEVDPIGNVNNMTYVPDKPTTATAIQKSRSGGLIVVDKDKAVPAYTVPTPASIAASLPANGDASAAEPEPISLDPVQEVPDAEKPLPKDEAVAPAAIVAPIVPISIEPVVDPTTDSTKPDAISKDETGENPASTHTPTAGGEHDTPASVPEKEEVANPAETATGATSNTPVPYPEAKDVSKGAESVPSTAVNVPLPATPTPVPASETESPVPPPKSPTTPPVPPNTAVEAIDAATPPATPAKANGVSTTGTPSSAPATPPKGKKHAFPSEGGADENGASPGSIRSRFGSIAGRKGKRAPSVSIIHKLKDVFLHHDHKDGHVNGGEHEKDVSGSSGEATAVNGEQTEGKEGKATKESPKPNRRISLFGRSFSGKKEAK